MGNRIIDWSYSKTNYDSYFVQIKDYEPSFVYDKIISYNLKYPDKKIILKEEGSECIKGLNIKTCYFKIKTDTFKQYLTLVRWKISEMKKSNFFDFVKIMDYFNEEETIIEDNTDCCKNKCDDENCNDTVIENDIINKPNHYQLLVKDRVVEVIDIIDSVIQNYPPKQAFRVANIIKYVLRANKKNGLEDFKKAKKYIEMLLEME